MKRFGPILSNNKCEKYFRIKEDQSQGMGNKADDKRRPDGLFKKTIRLGTQWKKENIHWRKGWYFYVQFLTQFHNIPLLLKIVGVFIYRLFFRSRCPYLENKCEKVIKIFFFWYFLRNLYFRKRFLPIPPCLCCWSSSYQYPTRNIWRLSSFLTWKIKRKSY